VSTPARSVNFFVLAGLMEIGGGYLVWLWLRERRAWWVGALGALVLLGYGVVPTLQPANFGRVYAAYGGVFIAMSMLWGWWVGRAPPRRLGRGGRRPVRRRRRSHHVRAQKWVKGGRRCQE